MYSLVVTHAVKIGVHHIPVALYDYMMTNNCNCYFTSMHFFMQKALLRQMCS